jgi:hypothetical protein
MLKIASCSNLADAVAGVHQYEVMEVPDLAVALSCGVTNSDLAATTLQMRTTSDLAVTASVSSFFCPARRFRKPQQCLTSMHTPVSLNLSYTPMRIGHRFSLRERVPNSFIRGQFCLLKKYSHR